MLNLRGLLGLRGLGVIAQLVIILLAKPVLGISLPLAPMLLILGLLTGWSLYSLRHLEHFNTRKDHLFIQLVIDVLALGGMLYLSGGATNPFAWLFLLPIVVAATSLTASRTWAITLLSMLVYSLLMRYYRPLDYGHGHEDFNLHVVGMWFGFLLSAATVAHFIGKMARDLRHRDRKLAEARERQWRNEQLVALGTLAAGAAHELGTPLATMSLVSEALLEGHDAQRHPELHRHLEILQTQISRCKTALATLSAGSGASQACAGQAVELRDHLHQLLDGWLECRPDVRLQRMIDPDSPTLNILAERTLDQALTNILDNAANASPGAVRLEAQWDRNRLEIRIEDRGPGLSQPDAARLGKQPFGEKHDQPRGGLGLGLFLAHATLERLGGTITLFNRQQGGVCTLIELPLNKLEITS